VRREKKAVVAILRGRKEGRRSGGNGGKGVQGRAAHRRGKEENILLLPIPLGKERNWRGEGKEGGRPRATDRDVWWGEKENTTTGGKGEGEKQTTTSVQKKRKSAVST